MSGSWIRTSPPSSRWDPWRVRAVEGTSCLTGYSLWTSGELHTHTHTSPIFNTHFSYCVCLPSPVSRDELGSVQEFSPISEGLNSISNTQTLEHLLDLTAQPETSLYPMLQAGSAAALGDLNKNLLIQGYNPASLTSSSPRSAQLLHSLSPGKLDV